jgi:hypothetical protein
MPPLTLQLSAKASASVSSVAGSTSGRATAIASTQIDGFGRVAAEPDQRADDALDLVAPLSSTAR